MLSLELTPLPESHARGLILDSKGGATLRDEQDAEAMQVEPVFFRRFELPAMIALNSTVVLPWQNVLVVLGFVLYNGGTGGLFFSFIIAIAGFVPVYLSIAELSSSFVKSRISTEIVIFD